MSLHDFAIQTVGFSRIFHRFLEDVDLATLMPATSRPSTALVVATTPQSLALPMKLPPGR